MNTVLEALLEQSELQAYYDAQSGQIEKFAELIVRECMSITSACSDKVHPDDLIQLFSEHFGVQKCMNMSRNWLKEPMLT